MDKPGSAYNIGGKGHISAHQIFYSKISLKWYVLKQQ